MTPAAALTSETQILTPQKTENRLSKEIDKATKLGIILIALAIVLAAATAIIGYKFHAYQPLSQDYHYFGLSIIGIGGGIMSLIILYKGMNSLKDANPEARQDEFADVFEKYINDDPIKGIKEANRLFPNHFKKGFVTIPSLSRMTKRVLFSTEADANTFGNAIKEIFKVNFHVGHIVNTNEPHHYVEILGPQTAHND